MKQIPLIILLHTVTFIDLTLLLHLLAAESALSGWMWPAMGAGFITSMTGMAAHLVSRLLPRRFYATSHSTSNSYETHSWFAPVNMFLSFTMMCVPLGLSILFNSDAVLSSRHSGSLLYTLFFSGFLLLYPIQSFLQIIGDGTSGLRIYNDHIEARKVGRYGWSFTKDDISFISVIDDGSPVVVIHGKGQRIDRVLAPILPDGNKARIEGSTLTGISVHEINEKLIEFGYGNKIRLQLKE